MKVWRIARLGKGELLSLRKPPQKLLGKPGCQRTQGEAIEVIDRHTQAGRLDHDIETQRARQNELDLSVAVILGIANLTKPIEEELCLALPLEIGPAHEIADEGWELVDEDQSIASQLAHHLESGGSHVPPLVPQGLGQVDLDRTRLGLAYPPEELPHPDAETVHPCTVRVCLRACLQEASDELALGLQRFSREEKTAPTLLWSILHVMEQAGLPHPPWSQHQHVPALRPVPELSCILLPFQEIFSANRRTCLVLHTGLLGHLPVNVPVRLCLGTELYRFSLN